MAVDGKMTEVQRQCEALGGSPMSAELWTTAVELNDTLTQVGKLELRMRQAAREAGITDSQWNAIRRPG